MKKYILGLTIVSILAITNVGIAMEKKKEVKTSLSVKEEAELRQAMKDYKNNKSRAKQEKIIEKYRSKYPNDPLVKAKMNEKARFDSSKQPQKIKKEPVKKQVEPQVEKETLGYYGPASGWLEHELSTNSKQPANGTPNMRITNKSNVRILIGIHDRFWTKGTEKKVIEPKQTISFYIADADKDLSEWPMEVYVQELKYNSQFAKNGRGLSDIQPVNKGQIIDLEYNDDHTWFPEEYDKEEKQWYRSTESVRHLYQVRDGKKVSRS